MGVNPFVGGNGGNMGGAPNMPNMGGPGGMNNPQQQVCVVFYMKLYYFANLNDLLLNEENNFYFILIITLQMFAMCSCLTNSKFLLFFLLREKIYSIITQCIIVNLFYIMNF